MGVTGEWVVRPVAAEASFFFFFEIVLVLLLSFHLLPIPCAPGCEEGFWIGHPAA